MSHQACNQTSFNTELYSPGELVEAARRVMGDIDLDPASSLKANQLVKANRIFTKRGDGLTKKWAGRVWMNHPWGAKENACKPNCNKKRCETRGWHLAKDFPGNAAWINKLVGSYENGDVTEAMCITYASTSEAWFKPLKQYAICFLDGRTAFHDPQGNELDQNTKGCAVTYLGPNIGDFYAEFSAFGDVMLPFMHNPRGTALLDQLLHSLHISHLTNAGFDEQDIACFGEVFRQVSRKTELIGEIHE
ncbi:hypothetical protein [uncultured Alteromonas sp.]|jgi:ParB family chromosome partitioning protein|uniref:hypothetical protein n=1 Tax=uncultured Alteromonas sp. TaxID=179113 RepID=UPI0025FAF15E|nr:hypothetical protein [uncultured Alteromonas sp.]